MLFEARGDGAEVFELLEEAFDEVAVAIEEGLKAGTRLRVGIGLMSA